MRHAWLAVVCIATAAACNERRYDYRTEKEWVAELNARNAQRRAWAANALGAMGAKSDATLHALVEALNDRSSTVRVNAAKALAKLDEGTHHRDRILLMLWRAVQDPRDEAQLTAAEALGLERYRDDRSVPILIAALQDSSAAMRATAAASLRQFGKRAQSAVPALQAALRDTNEMVQHEARDALATIAGRDTH